MIAIDEARRAPLQTFFERYAELSLARDPRPLAAMYAPSFLAGGPQGTMSFSNDARFLDWLEEVSRFNQQHGMRSLEVVSVEPIALSPIHTLAVVKWGARFDKTGDRRIEFQISYLLESEKILAYLSQADQEAEMKAQGLL